MKFVLFHGAFGSPDGNWFPELKEKLETLGQEVISPHFPVESWETFTKAGPTIPPKNQSLSSWMKEFDRYYRNFKKGEKLCFVGHSLGCVFILHVVDTYNLHLDSAIFVSPFMSRLNSLWQFDHANASFYKTDFDFDTLKKLIPISYVLYSGNDPYVDKSHPTLFGNSLDSSLIYVKKAGHMNSEVNLNEFPLVLELCKTRLDLSLYQKYLAHRRELYAMEYVKEKPEATIKLKPKEIMNEGVFHFRHLKQEGFCTFISWQKDWDPQDNYYVNGRHAAKRMKNFTRVFLIRESADFKKSLLLKQIKLDLEGGVKVYLCLYQDVEDKIDEPDFGIWDNDYLCIICYKNNWEKAKEIILDSRHANILKAQEWKRIVLQHATEIKNMNKDITKFIRSKFPKYTSSTRI